jgi:hypothetical protein
MPYIAQEQRGQLNCYIQILEDQIRRLAKSGQRAGLVNYIVTKLVWGLLDEQNIAPAYARYNEMIGALECAKLELYRRLIAEYEDCKIKENGDI